ERRAQALALDSSLLAELLGQADLRELLDPGVVEQTEAELQRLARGRACRDLEGLADRPRARGPLSAAGAAAPGTERPPAPRRRAGRGAEGRARGVGAGGGARGAVGGAGGGRRVARGGPLLLEGPAGFAGPVPDPREDLGEGYARCDGPFPTADVARRYGL